MIQESHCMVKLLITEIGKKTKTRAFMSEGTTMGRGTMIFVHESDFIKDSKLKSKDTLGNIISVSIKFNDEMVELVNIYGPIDSGSRKKLFQLINEQIQGTSNKIIGGDFNNFVNFNLDCIGGSLNNFCKKKAELDVLEEMSTIHGYVDTYRALHPRGQAFTYTSRTSNNYRARLDRIYIHNMFNRILIKSEVIPIVFSDHDMYVITLDKNDGTDRLVRGRVIWKYNPKILAIKDNMKVLEDRWIEWRNHKTEYTDLICRMVRKRKE